MQNYNKERGHVPLLPPLEKTPCLEYYADNGLSVAAFDGEKMLGFLCVAGPWDGAFGLSGLRHVYSPMGANGTVAENREKIYARLYQAAAEKWVRAGITSHGICLYAHDTAAQSQFFRYGFGMRTVDAIRGTDEMAAPACEGYTFSELMPHEALDILPIENTLDRYYIESPFFMHREPSNKDEFLQEYENCKPIYFVARYGGQIIAFIKAEHDGETFIKDTAGYLHCKGLYCLPAHRGKGISQNLINLLTKKIKAQGYTMFGTDFESFNPSGAGFWQKYFSVYTYGVVRRIDENAVKILAN